MIKDILIANHQDVSIYLTQDIPDFIDIEEYADFYNDLYYAESEYKPNNFHTYCMVAKIDNEIVGTASFQISRIIPCNRTYLFRDFVKPQYRGRGIYKLLFKERLNYIREILHSKLTEVATASTVVENIIKEYGFIENGLEVQFDMKEGLITSKKFYCVL